MSDDEKDQLTQDLENEMENIVLKPQKKRVLSPEALEKLKKAREKALLVRKKQFELKKQAKADLVEAKVRTKIAKDRLEN